MQNNDLNLILFARSLTIVLAQFPLDKLDLVKSSMWTNTVYELMSHPSYTTQIISINTKIRLMQDKQNFETRN